MQVNYLIILLLSLCSLSLYPQIAGKDLEVTSNKVFYDSKNEIIYLEMDVSIISRDLNIKSNSAKIFLKNEIIEFSGAVSYTHLTLPTK